MRGVRQAVFSPLPPALTPVSLHQGDHGSKVLKPMPTGVVWAAGSVVETTIFLKANHAGGWIYRLCKVGENLTEVCSRLALLTPADAQGAFACRPQPAAASRWSIQCSPHAPSTHTTAEHLLTCAHLHTCDHTNIQDCFERTPVPFAEGMSQVLRMHSGEETSVEPVYLSEGTWPPNSTWAMNPIPECCKSSCSLLACTFFSKAGC
jgi:hypothetical protein